MASFRVDWRPSTKRDLRQIAPDQVVRIVAAVAGLSGEPRPHGSQKLHGVAQTYRIRVGDYRVVYTVSDEDQRARFIECGIGERFTGNSRTGERNVENAGGGQSRV